VQRSASATLVKPAEKSVNSNEITKISNSAAERERLYTEKIKGLKAENKKLITLLRDSEKLFYQKLKETKKESEDLNAVFKQLWPLIKHKVKDPNNLLQSVSDLQGVVGEESAEKSEGLLSRLDELKVECDALKRNEFKLLEQL
jgi:hypothetical protein